MIVICSCSILSLNRVKQERPQGHQRRVPSSAGRPEPDWIVIVPECESTSGERLGTRVVSTVGYTFDATGVDGSIDSEAEDDEEVEDVEEVEEVGEIKDDLRREKVAAMIELPRSWGCKQSPKTLLQYAPSLVDWHVGCLMALFKYTVAVRRSNIFFSLSFFLSRFYL